MSVKASEIKQIKWVNFGVMLFDAWMMMIALGIFHALFAAVPSFAYVHVLIGLYAIRTIAANVKAAVT